ncbi:MAG: hypothetical protein IKW11_00485 [Bacteroidales bacterium]|nr:hypothetical protein [Bacteroidales bacterium]
MKKTFKFMLAVAAACAVVLSCEKPETPQDDPKDPTQEQPETPGEEEEEPAPEPTLEVSLTELAFEAAAGEATFTVTTNQDWTAATEAAWITLDPASGAASTEAATVKVTAAENTVTEARTATVTVTAGELTKTISVTQAAAIPQPDGTEANPYLVSDAATLKGMSDLLVANATTYFKLTANIDLASAEWTPISTTETVDETTVVKAIALDGCNYTISNAKDALFSTLCGSVQNLTIDGAAINASNTVGVVANQVKDATIKDVEVKNSSIVSSAGEAGGAVGKVSNGTLENVKVACNVSGTQQLGVLVGRFEDGKIKNCTVTGEITGANYYIGGLAGLMIGGSVEGCSADVNATTASTAYGRIGCFIGQVEGGSISTSHAAGSVTSGGHYGGAFIGVLAKNVGVNISKCYATGTVNLPAGVNKSGGAGFIGAVENDGTFVISDCYTTATVTAYRWSSAFLGRMLNNCKVTLTNCYTKANCTFTQPANCGALVGDVATTATLTYSGCVAWNVNALTLFVRPGVETAPEGNYFGTEGTISEKAKALGWNTTIWDLSKDDPTLK